MNKLSLFRLGIASAVMWGSLCGGTFAAPDPLKISLVQRAGVNSKGEERFVEPAGRVIEMVRQPLSLLIEIKNQSDSTANVTAEDETSYSFEITDEAGAVKVVKRKKSAGGRSSALTYKHLNAGDVIIIPILIDADTWENIPEFVFGKKQTFKVRVIYQDYRGRPLYSPAYTWIVALGSLSK